MKNRKRLLFLIASCLVLNSSMFVFAGNDNECQHINTEISKSIEPKCTSYGYTEGTYCNDCHEFITGHDKIDPIGHIDANEDGFCDECNEQFTIREEKKATCTEDGYTGDKLLDNGRILIGKNIPATGHTDTNKDYICDVCHQSIDKNDITLTLHFYVTKEDYEKNKEMYENAKVKENCDIESCVYITAKLKTKQAIETILPEYPVLARYEFQWVDKKNNAYNKYKFHKDTELYMAYGELGEDKPFGQAGNDAFWIYYPEEKIIYFYGRGSIWNNYKKRTELPWYEYLMKAEKTQIGGAITADAWTIMVPNKNINVKPATNTKTTTQKE